MKRFAKNSNQDYALVYSTDPMPPKAEKPSTENGPYVLKPAIRMERKGRGGKSVTVLFKLPAHETLLKALLQHLKKSLGSGGTSYVKDQEGIVEVQGEHQKIIPDLLKKFKWP